MHELTDRQREILDVIVDHQRDHGFPPSVREIGSAVGLKSPATVKTHLVHIFGKLGVDDRTAAVTVALEQGIIRLSG